MKVAFHTPPPHQRIGGLDAAIAGLQGALASAGVTVLAGNAAASERVDVAHFHGLWQPDFPALAALYRAKGAAVVISPHGMLEPWAWRHKWWKKWPYFLLRERAFLRKAECLLATSPLEAGRLRKRFSRSHIASLPLGLTGDAAPDYTSARQSLGWDAGETVILFLSRIHQKKGLDLLLEALVDLPARKAIRLVIVGGGAPGYVQQLESYAASQGSSLPAIDWKGEVWGEDRWKYFQAADLFCLPSHSENFGLAVLEALQVGTPVLTTEDTPWAQMPGGPPVYIGTPSVPSIRRLLIDFLDAPPHDGEARCALAAHTRQQFAWAELVPRYIVLYRELTAAAHE